jgi:hypothetical protein
MESSERFRSSVARPRTRSSLTRSRSAASVARSAETSEKTATHATGVPFESQTGKQETAALKVLPSLRLTSNSPRGVPMQRAPRARRRPPSCPHPSRRSRGRSGRARPPGSTRGAPLPQDCNPPRARRDRTRRRRDRPARVCADSSPLQASHEHLEAGAEPGRELKAARQWRPRARNSPESESGRGGRHSVRGPGPCCPKASCARANARPLSAGSTPRGGPAQRWLRPPRRPAKGTGD